MFWNIILFTLYEMFNYFCFIADNNVYLRMIHVGTRIAYYVYSLYVLYNIMNTQLNKRENNEWYHCIINMFISMLILRVYQTLGYFLGNILFIPISELYYSSLRMLWKFWKVYYIFEYSDKLQIFKQSLYFVLAHIMRYFVCIFTWIEWKQPKDYEKTCRYRLYGCMTMIFYLMIIAVEFIRY